MNRYAKNGLCMSKNEAAMQKTAITTEIEKIKGNNSALKMKNQNFEKKAYRYSLDEPLCKKSLLYVKKIKPLCITQ